MGLVLFPINRLSKTKISSEFSVGGIFLKSRAVFAYTQLPWTFHT